MKPGFYGAIRHLEHSNHYSDLYLVATNEARTLMQAYEVTGSTFKDNITGKITFDIPFAYAPYWDELGRKTLASKGASLMIDPNGPEQPSEPTEDGY